MLINIGPSLRHKILLLLLLLLLFYFVKKNTFLKEGKLNIIEECKKSSNNRKGQGEVNN